MKCRYIDWIPILRKDKYIIYEDGSIFCTKDIRYVKGKRIEKEVMRPLKGWIKYNKKSNMRYKCVDLTDTESGFGKKHFHLHRLVYEAFVGVIPNDKEIDHIDKNTMNNHYTNLRAVSKQYNLFHRDGGKILVNDEVDRLFELQRKGLSTKEISKELGVSFKTVRNWIKGESKIPVKREEVSYETSRL